VNLTAPFLLSRAVLPHMRTAGGGTIVNVSSVAGRRGWANAAAYCATKFGLTGLTQALAAEGAPRGVRVVCLYPGAMATHWGTWSAADRDQPRMAAPEDALPPEDVAGYIAWLACAPAHLIVPEAVVAPIRERGWPRPRHAGGIVFRLSRIGRDGFPGGQTCRPARLPRIPEVAVTESKPPDITTSICAPTTALSRR